MDLQIMSLVDIISPFTVMGYNADIPMILLVLFFIAENISSKSPINLSPTINDIGSAYILPSESQLIFPLAK